jgi:hypothetical protein
MICWCANEKKITYKTREKLLIILDSLGKWSILDSYVMIMMIVAFRFQVNKQFSQLSGGLNVYVQPGFSLYLFIIATISSLMFTHIIIHFHRGENRKYDDSKKNL